MLLSHDCCGHCLGDLVLGLGSNGRKEALGCLDASSRASRGFGQSSSCLILGDASLNHLVMSNRLLLNYILSALNDSVAALDGCVADALDSLLESDIV